MNKYYYKQSLGAKNDRIAFLEATQVDNYLSKMESEKNYRNQIIRDYEEKIEELVADIYAKEVLITGLKTMSHNLEISVGTSTLTSSALADLIQLMEGKPIKFEGGER